LDRCLNGLKPIWYWDLQEKEKMFVKMQMSSVAVIFLIGKFSAKFDLKSMISSLTR
jgi:hypothetical protein